MRGEAFLLISVLSLINGATVKRYDTSDPSQAAAICALDFTNTVLVAHEYCNRFYKCDHGKPVEYSCSGDLQFDPEKGICDWSYTIECGDRIISDKDCDPEEGNGNHGNDNEDNNPNDNGSSAGNCDPSEAPQICAGEMTDRILVAHENCNQYYICNNGLPVSQTCPGNLLFNPTENQCDWPINVYCGDRIIPDPDCEDSADNGGSNDNNSNQDNEETGSGSDTDHSCHDNPAEAPAVCAAEGSEGVLVAHENCNQFYICYGGRPVAMFCLNSLLYNPSSERCDWHENVDCGDRVVPKPDNENNGNSGGSTESSAGDNIQNGGNDNNDNGIASGCHDNPAEAPSICAADRSDGVLVAHENCNQFYICNDGRPVTQTCAASLLYNPSTERCDWPENVDCGVRVIPNPDNENNGNGGGGTESGVGDNNQNGGNDNNGNGIGCGCHANPAEAPSVCAADGSDGVLVAHENCNQFYLCNGGRQVTQTCAASLLYNPSTERCDWPENVDCGDRVIPNPDNENNGNGGGGTESGVGDNNQNGGNDNNDNGIGCGCHDNPTEAPSVCAAYGSDGVLVAHENCNQFYICNGGRPVTQTCAASLLYNPSSEKCDWPEKVDCGDRVVPNPDNENNGNGGGGTESGAGDNNQNGGNDNNGNGIGCGCHDNPAEAPSVCAADGSDGVLVAHENCNQFYLCNGGRQVTQTCAASLLYNPSTERCDWPENVDCGDRVIPNPDNENNGNGGGGTESGVGDNNQNGGNDNNDNGIGCGCHDNPAEAPSVCAADGSDGVLVAHENCNQFYICNGGRPVTQTCAASLLYNPSTERCDWPENVDCGDRVIPNPDNENNGNGGGGTESGVGDNNQNGGNDNNDNGIGCGCHDNPTEAPSVCAADGSDGVLVAHENCNQFYICNGGRPVTQTCAASLLYNPSSEKCDWPEKVDCGDRVVPNPDNENNGNGGGSTESGAGDNNQNGGNDNNGNGIASGCNDNPAEAPSVCAADGSDGVLVAHENCNQFYICNGGRPVTQTCAASLLYNPSTERCDWPENVDCGVRVIPNPDNENNGNGGGGTESGAGDNNQNGGNDNNDNGIGCGCHDNPTEAPSVCAADESDGVLVAHENCNQFYICNGGRPVTQSCAASLLYNPSTERCDWPENVDCGDRVIPNPDNENNGNSGGSTESGAGDNNQNGGNDNNDNGIGCGCHDNPTEAPSVCAADGSDGVLVAHENCNQFYICNGGRPVTQTCAASLLYNPSTERCDWPEKVDCDDRVFPNPDNENNGNGGGGTESGVGDNNQNGGNDNNDNGIGCGCHDNPTEAPSVCAADGSDGVLVAHENCNQFYICNGGRPVTQTCAASLLYNPSSEECDWPEKVDCGDRVVPNPDNENNGNGGGSTESGAGDNNQNGGNDNNGNGIGCGCHDNPAEAPSVCAADGSDGVLVAHENCNQFYICNGGRPVTQTCAASLLYNPSSGECDWPEKVDCGDRVVPNPDNENNGNGGGGTESGAGDNNQNGGNDNNDNGIGCGCHDNPTEAPSVCAAYGSDGVLVAHENCNQFYICNGGRPVTQTCAASLLYNPSSEKCDWPEKVDCGDRVVPNPDNENNGNGGGSTESGAGDNNQNGGNDNNGNGIGCGCHDNPAEAPSVCAADGSDGVLVAHENCNQFYICNGGRPVTQTCAASLLYNPSSEECDWPENVDCGDRVVPNPDNENNGNSGGSTESGAGDNNQNVGNDNNGNGIASGCNDNPAEAPSVCAADGSDGVLVAHENCNQFYICNGGRPVTQTCAASLLYNPSSEECDWPEKVDCGDRVVPNPDNENNGNGCDGTESGAEDNNQNGGNDNNGNGIGCGCHDNPTEAPSVCAADGSDGILVAHENCNQFYICNGGRPVTQSCAASLLYNPSTEECDWPENVDCGDRLKPVDCEDSSAQDGPSTESINNYTTEAGLENESQVDQLAQDAREVCSLPGSDGQYLPHENCNQFHVCLGGVPIVLTCPASLLYDVVSHTCLWPQFVNCGNRIK